MNELIKCSCCEKMIPANTAELTFMRPDIIAALTKEQREQRCQQEWEDGYTLDNERFFVKGLIPFPIQSSEDNYCLGAWIEVSETSYAAIIDDWENDRASPSKDVIGNLSNQIPYSKNSLGCLVKMVATDEKSRPYLTILDEKCSLMAEQKRGISRHRAAEFTNTYRNHKRWKVIEQKEFAPTECSCCKGKIRAMSGCVENEQGDAEADYWLRFTENHNGSFIIAISLNNGGKQRVAVLLGKKREGRLTYWVQTKEESPWDDFGDCGAVMDREEVLDDLYKSLFFDVVDKVAADDTRLQTHIR
jgi:hypothetical protein